MTVQKQEMSSEDAKVFRIADMIETVVTRSPHVESTVLRDMIHAITPETSPAHSPRSVVEGGRMKETHISSGSSSSQEEEA